MISVCQLERASSEARYICSVVRRNIAIAFASSSEHPSGFCVINFIIRNSSSTACKNHQVHMPVFTFYCLKRQWGQNNVPHLLSPGQIHIDFLNLWGNPLTTVYCPGYGVMFLNAHCMFWCIASCRVKERDAWQHMRRMP